MRRFLIWAASRKIVSFPQLALFALPVFASNHPSDAASKESQPVRVRQPNATRAASTVLFLISNRRCIERERSEAAQQIHYITIVRSVKHFSQDRPTSPWRLFGYRRGPCL